jgi:hypothetical protein
MSVHQDGSTIILRGHCPVEDAEPLLALLQNQPDSLVDISEATHLNAAVLQVLLAYRRELSGQCRDLFLQTWIIPLLKSTI